MTRARPPDDSGPRQVTEPARGHHSPPPSRREATHSSVPRGLAALLALSNERDRWLRRVRAAWREGYQAALGDAVVASLLRIWPEPGHVPEIEKRRYPPDGREHFGDPRPGDYLGGPVAAWDGGRRS